MLTLLIVDDEPSTRNGLAEYIDWTAHGITCVFTAEDGEEALQLYDEKRPDLVLTDVKMPGMDGIELAERIRERSHSAKIIFISGHDDVSYMKSALQVEAVDYIMKPVNRRELTAVIAKTVSQVMQERDRLRLISDMNAKLSQSLPLLREKFWLRAIRDGFEPSLDLHERLSFLELRLNVSGKYCVFVISVDDWTTLSETMSERDRQLISFALLNISQEIVDRTYQGYAFEHREGEFVAVLALATEADDDGFFSLLDSIRGTVGELLKLSVTIGVGHSVSGLRQLPASYDSAIEAVNQRLLLGKNRIIMNDWAPADPEPLYKLRPQQAGLLASALRAGDAAQSLEQLERLFGELMSAPKTNLRNFQHISLQLLLLGAHALMEMGIPADDPAIDENVRWAELAKRDTAEEMHELLKQYFARVCEKVSARRSDKPRRVVEEIKAIAEERHADPALTIQHIADRIYLTSTYISLIFKQETGSTIHEYVTGVRMERAKAMLIHTRKKLADICASVGYQDPSYFTKQFKRYTGLTPKEYRERFQ